MNYIFDIGNVLIDFKPMPFLRKLFSSQILIDKVYEIIFKSPEWKSFDLGLVNYKEICDIFCMKEPDYREDILFTMSKLPEMLTPISETVALLPKIKASGHNLYYLSNYPKEPSELILKKYLFFSLFDGGVFSCDVHMIKPAPEIYDLLLDKYSLSPEKCLFFDDTEENIIAARLKGINGVLFTGAECVEAYL